MKKLDLVLELGSVVQTQGVTEEIGNIEKLTKCLMRHNTCDWGELCEEDWHMNNLAIIGGEDRVLSAYTIDGVKIWIITDWDRSVTTVLLPSEY